MQSLPSVVEDLPYDRLRAYLKALIARPSSGKTAISRNFDNPLRCRISKDDWFKLSQDLDLDEYEGGVQFSYYISTSILFVQSSTSPVHEVMVRFLGEYLHGKLPPNVYVATGQSFLLTSKKYAGLEKRADLAIVAKKPGQDEQVKWALEIGFSETYDELLEDVKSWLIGRTGDVVHCVLVKITEDPVFTCPVRGISDEEFERRGLKNAHTITEGDFTGEGYGPVLYDGDRWAGPIKEIYWEVWRLNPGTGKPELVGDREYLVRPVGEQSVPSKSDSSPQIHLDQILSSIQEGEHVSPNWNKFRDLLQESIKPLAKYRYQHWYFKRGKEEGDDPCADPTYDPDSE